MMNSPAQRADDTLRAILRAQYEGVPALRVDSPPGAGKTGVVVRLAMQSMAIMGERCMLVTQTNAQALDLARRLASGFPNHAITLFKRSSLALPPALQALTNLVVVSSARDLPRGPCVVIANSAKWSYLDEVSERFDLQVVDEAFQLSDHRFQSIANLAKRIVLVGDPGQIAPVITCEVERWREDPAGPHVPCPEALLHRHPHIPRLALPISRRLVPDTVRIVQPTFYPDLPFDAITEEDERGLEALRADGGRFDDAISRACDGMSMMLLELPSRATGQRDGEMADALTELTMRLFERDVMVREGEGRRRLRPENVGVVCAHVSQVSAVRERLPEACRGVLVETADRFQGLERDVMLVHHPLSGRSDASAFHLDAGRLCVMLSRHRVACFVLGRAGIQEALEENTPSGDRVLGVEHDPEYLGWRAHRHLMSALRHRSVCVRGGTI